MGDILVLPASKFQETYDRLRHVASRCEDDNQDARFQEGSRVPLTLSACDLAALLRKERRRFGIEMTDLGNNKIFVRRDDLLQELYRRLASLDQFDGGLDGKIDPARSPLRIALQDDPKEDVAALVSRRFAPSIFEVRKVTAPAGRSAQGSAFIVEKTEVRKGVYRYLLATNNHVVDTSNIQELRWVLSHPDLRGAPIEARVVGVHRPADVALLETEMTIDLPVLNFGDSDKLKPGQTVVAVGNTIARGLIAIEGKVISPRDGLEGYPYSLIRSESGANHGNSGGPQLLPDTGEVIGIVVAGDDRAALVANFDIPSNRVKRAIEEIKASRETGGRIVVGYWGFNFLPLAPDERHEILPSYQYGVWVNRVDRSSPAEKAGLKSGDILIAVNGSTDCTRIDRIMDSYLLNSQILDSRPGETITLTVMRGGQTIQLKLTVGATEYRMDNTVHTEYPFAVRDIEDSERQRGLTINYDTQGVVAILDDPSGRVFQLVHGSIIQAVEGQATPTVGDFLKILQQARVKARQEGRRTIRLDIYLPGTTEKRFALLPVN